MTQTPHFGHIPISTKTPDPLYSPYGYGRSNGWSFLTNTNPRPCTVSEMPLKYEWLCDFGVGLLGIPAKRVRRPKFVFFGPKSH